ncbi:hypothetical protein DJ66_0521 [Candidatus Liberibacter solanacearum]|uniref:Uncharacterized protein n=1 Tax=Candidatus Liberibacter solanacearum TaxID=556287 RepID=A0A0F4VKM5_9HYPH|nr:hypothetical protein DJ66_0521 [Candidatus Liberibacter solanacearum]
MSSDFLLDLLLFIAGCGRWYIKDKIFSANPLLSRDQLFILKILDRAQKTIQKK